MTDHTNTAAAAPAVAIPPGYRPDAKGRLVPESQIRPQDLLEDQTVEKILGYAEELSAQIARFGAHTLEDVDSYLAILREQYGASKGGRKGNITLTSYDGTRKVSIQVADRIAWGPELQIARDLVDECVGEWAEGARSEIRTLVQHAFQPDKQGEVSREAVLALRRIEIDDPRWKKAIAAIGDAIRVVGSKTYVRFYRRARPDARWEAVPIDLASLS